jgi:hypothetical protein
MVGIEGADGNLRTLPGCMSCGEGIVQLQSRCLFVEEPRRLAVSTKPYHFRPKSEERQGTALRQGPMIGAKCPDFGGDLQHGQMVVELFDGQAATIE